MNKIQKMTMVVLLAAVSMLLSCGGSSKKTVSDQTTQEPPPFDCTHFAKCEEVRTAYEGYLEDEMPQDLAAERASSLHLRPIQADAAYARGWTGAGVELGYVESEIDDTHPELQGVLIADPNRHRASGEEWPYALYTETEAKAHALAAAAIAAGRRNGVTEIKQGMHGIAFEAKVRFVSDLAERFELVQWNTPYGDSAAIAYLNNYVEIGFTAATSVYDDIGDENSIEGVELRYDFTLPVLRQSATPAHQRTIWVLISGNEGLPNPVGEASLGHFFPELRSHLIVATAVDSEGVITDYANRCGPVTQNCIAAPGDLFSAQSREEFGETTDEDWRRNPRYSAFSGTSAAAPVVAGSLAILRQAFPELGTDELVQRLFRTANKRGIYSDRSIYGQGLVDLDAATRPAGEMRLATAKRLNGASATPQSSQLGFAGAAGTPAELAQTTIMLLDELDTPWYVTGDRFVRNPALDLTATRIEALQQRLQYPETESQPWLDLAGKYHARGQLQYRPQQTMQWAMRSAPNQDSVGFRLTPAVRAGQSLSFSLGALHEGKAFLGSKASGAFGQLSATSVMSEVSKTWQLGFWTTKARASLGLTMADVSDGLLRESDPVVASAFALETTRQFRHSNLRFSVSQPLRIESGSLRLAYPATRTRDRTLIVKETELSLEPDARQLDYEVSWMHAASSHSKVGLSAWATTNAGHARSASVKTGVAAVYQKRF